MTTLISNIGYLKEPQTRMGRNGEYRMQGIRLDWKMEDGKMQSLYGNLFDGDIDAFQALNLQKGDRIMVTTDMMVNERNGFVSNLVHFQSPQRVSDNAVKDGFNTCKS